MNRIKSLLTLVVGSFIVFGCCKEIPPTITPCQTNRVVLVEEFTGIHCSNCPAATKRLEELSKQYSGKIITVGIHTGNFSNPYNGFDLKCDNGVKLATNYLGPISGYPRASINRRLFEGENELSQNPRTWAGFIASEFCQRPIAELAIVPTFDATTRKASVTVDMTPSSFFKGLIDDNLAITVMITESNIIGYQKEATSINYAYVHKHVLRDIITDDYTGDILINKGNILSPQQKIITDYEIPAGWDADNCHVVAFIHYKDDGNKAVIQAVEAALN